MSHAGVPTNSRSIATTRSPPAAAPNHSTRFWGFGGTARQLRRQSTLVPQVGVGVPFLVHRVERVRVAGLMQTGLQRGSRQQVIGRTTAPTSMASRRAGGLSRRCIPCWRNASAEDSLVSIFSSSFRVIWSRNCCCEKPVPGPGRSGSGGSTAALPFLLPAAFVTLIVTSVTYTAVRVARRARWTAERGPCGLLVRRELVLSRSGLDYFAADVNTNTASWLRSSRSKNSST